MTTDTRAPLYLTASEAKNWFSLHSDDIGREVIIVEWKPAELSEEHLSAFRGIGMWQAGLCGGQWPEKTYFSKDVLDRPPYQVWIGSGLVRIRGAGSTVYYSLNRETPGPVRERLEQLGSGARYAERVL